MANFNLIRHKRNLTAKDLLKIIAFIERELVAGDDRNVFVFVKTTNQNFCPCLWISLI